MNKTLSIILTILMIATTVPFAFAAEGDVVMLELDDTTTYHGTLQDAFEAGKTGTADAPAKITLLQSTEESVVVDNSGVYILELNGNSISSNFYTLDLSGDMVVTIKDSVGDGGITATEYGVITIDHSVELTILSGTITGSIMNSGGQKNEATLNIEGGTFNDEYCNVSFGAKYINISGGEFNSNNSNIEIESWNSVKVTGSPVFKATREHFIFGGGTLDLSEHSFDKYYLYQYSEGTIILPKCYGIKDNVIAKNSHTFTDSSKCDVCDYECPHEKYTMGICDICKYVCPHSFTEFNETVAPKCGVAGKEVASCDYGCDVTDEREIPALGHKDDDGDNGCGSEFAVIEGETYVVLGDITYTGLNYYITDTPGCYKAGDGYAVIKPADAGTELILYNATIDVREEAVSGASSENDAVCVYGDLNFTFIGTNTIYAKEGYKAFKSTGSSAEDAQLVINGAEGAVLNLYGELFGYYITVKSGTVNVYEDAINAYQYFTVEKDAVVTAVGGDNNELYLNIGVISPYGITVEGILNAAALEIVEQTDYSTHAKYVIYGDVTAHQDIDVSLASQQVAPIDLVIPEDASLTIPEGCTINLDSFINVDIRGELIVNGTLICTHKGGEATCTEKAVCDVCGREYGEVLGHTPLEAVKENEVAPKCGVAGSYDLVVYCDVCGEELDRDTVAVDALTHTDADGDYLCDNGCGHEFEKPADPTPDTPDTPDEPTDDTCDHICHSNNAIAKVLWKIISFFYRLFNIQQYCDCGVLHYDAPVFG